MGTRFCHYRGGRSCDRNSNRFAISLFWPNFMELAGNVIALPLFMETFAFFFEAIFLGIYLYTWDRFENQKKHLLLLIPVAIGASFSAVFITIVNAFMNAPQGFDIVNGELDQHQSATCDVQSGDANESGTCCRDSLYDGCLCACIDCSIPFVERVESCVS